MKKKATVRVSVQRCYVYVEGENFHCPLCGVLVMSGTEHECSTKADGKRTSRTRPAKGPR